jgi:hypothetical protein
VYKGKTITLSTPEDFRAWIEERKKRYPTQARIEAKQAERKALQEKRKQAKFERKHKAKAQAKPAETAEKSHATPPPAKAQDDVERQKKKLEKHLRKAQKLRALLEKSESDPAQESADAPQPSAAEPSSEGAATGGAQDAANSTDSADSSDSSDSSSDSGDSGSESSSDDSDDAKDGAAAKKPETSRAKKVAKPRKVNTNVPCKYFIRDGQCLRKDCRFMHQAPEGEKRKSLFELVRRRLAAASGADFERCPRKSRERKVSRLSMLSRRWATRAVLSELAFLNADPLSLASRVISKFIEICSIIK